MKKPSYELFDNNTQAIVYGLQRNSVQRMLDFDYICNKQQPSVACIVNPGKEDNLKAFWGDKEILIPVYASLKVAMANQPQADVLINFASFRSAYGVTMEALASQGIKTVVIIAEGIPERQSREIARYSKTQKKIVIGPATVGGIKAGCFKVANTGGTLTSILASKLNRPGSVGFVSKSGGMSNEMYNIISRNTNGLYEGIAIGGDSYPGSTLLDHLLRYQANPKIQLLVCLGEVGGTDEYEIAEALKDGRLTKPLCVWVTGTCAKIFPGEVQFGHAGAKAGNDCESAEAKNKALKKAGAKVPKSFNDFDRTIARVYKKLVKDGVISAIDSEPPTPKIPVDYQTVVKENGYSIRKPTGIVTTISNDSLEECVYAGVPISTVIERGWSIGDVIGLLWFKKKFPAYASEFIEIVLKIIADHGPCVAGAHNAIITARAGKDLMSALATGILTIGPRFGGAIDGAAKHFKRALDEDLSPLDFVNDMKQRDIKIPGIGHRIKSLINPDKRVELLKDYAREYFPKTDLLDYALKVEEFTTTKKNNLILNVDGCVGVLFVDMLRSMDFSEKEIDEIIEIGGLNAMFVLGRSIGMIGHVLDQKRLKSGLYRHPMDDIAYMLPETVE